MIVLTLLLLSLATADLVRWSPEVVSPMRTSAGIVGAAIAVVSVSCIAGMPALEVAIVDASVLAVVVLWVLFDQLASTRGRPLIQLGWVVAALLGAFAASGSIGSLSGPLARWYAGLPFGFVHSVAVDQFLLGTFAGIFLLATTNRLVRLVLQAAGTPAVSGENALSGGRVLGPMERLFVGAMVVSGNLTAAAALIAAKGFLRLPEIRSNEDHVHGAGDHVTEYFLIGTFCSLLIASMLGALLSASG